MGGELNKTGPEAYENGQCSYERIQYFGSACDDLKSASLCLRRARASCRTGGADRQDRTLHHRRRRREAPAARIYRQAPGAHVRSEEHTSELQSLMRISYAVFRLKKKND